MELGRMSAIQDPTGTRVNLWQAGQSIGSVRVNEPGCPIWHELSTADIETASRFYSEVLGVSWESVPMEGGPDYTCLMVDGRAVAGAFPPQPGMEGMPPHWEVYFNVADCDATAGQVEGLGGQVLAPPWDVAGVGRMAVLKDPQGGVLALMQNPPEQEQPQ
jgi:predicted enzyme related to lactoylglutathione lyase